MYVHICMYQNIHITYHVYCIVQKGTFKGPVLSTKGTVKGQLTSFILFLNELDEFSCDLPLSGGHIPDSVVAATLNID